MYQQHHHEEVGVLLRRSCSAYLCEMVLQNKYKARASRRYNSARGSASDGRGRGRGGGRGGSSRIDQASFPSLPGQQQSDEGEEEDGEEDDDEEEKEEAKYAPRKLVSNAWRFNEPTDDDAADEEEPEPEVDLSGLLERVAKLDSSRTSKALSSDRAAQLALDAEAADVDASLLHLLDRQRERERRAAAATSDQASGDSAAVAAAAHTLPRHVLTDEQRAELEREGRRLQEEKVQRDKHERRARVLQHSGAAKTISLDIGSSRRREREGDEERKTQRRSDVDVASGTSTRLAPHLLYDSDDGGRDGGDVTDFLDELQRNTQSSANEPIIPVRRHDSSAVSTTRPAAPPTAKDEDFLDSIL